MFCSVAEEEEEEEEEEEDAIFQAYNISDCVCRTYSHKFNMGDTSFEKISFLGCFIDILLRPIFLNQNSDKHCVSATYKTSVLGFFFNWKKKKCILQRRLLKGAPRAILPEIEEKSKSVQFHSIFHRFT